MTQHDPDPERHTWLDDLRDFYAFTLHGRYFWVRAVEGGCGPVFGTLNKAIHEALLEAVDHPNAAAVHPSNTAIEILEVRRRERYRRVWCSDPTLMGSPIKTRPEPGVDFFPPEWVTEANLARATSRSAHSTGGAPTA